MSPFDEMRNQRARDLYRASTRRSVIEGPARRVSEILDTYVAHRSGRAPKPGTVILWRRIAFAILLPVLALTIFLMVRK